MSMFIDKLSGKSNVSKLSGVKRTEKSEKSTKNGQFDEMIISATRENSAEKKINDELSLKVKRELRMERENTVNELKNKVSQGIYELDAEKIASKIMFYRGEEI